MRSLYRYLYYFKKGNGLNRGKWEKEMREAKLRDLRSSIQKRPNAFKRKTGRKGGNVVGELLLVSSIRGKKEKRIEITTAHHVEGK